MRGRTRFWLAILYCLCVLGSPTAVPAADRQLDVLVIFGNQRAIPANVSIEKALRDQIAAVMPGRVRVFSEFLDLEYFQGQRYNEIVATFLRDKYRDLNLQAIVTVGPLALSFMQANRDRIAADVPIVYTNVSPETIRELAPAAGVYGVTVDFDIPRTLELALRLHPNARRFVVPIGSSNLDLLWERRLRAMQPVLPLPLEFLTGRTLPEIEKEFAALGRDAVVLIAVFRADAQGTIFFGVQVIEKLSGPSAAPIYAVFEPAIQSGAVGGYVVSYAQQGILAANIISGILQGNETSPRSISAKSVPTFDWRQLQRWGVDESLLPAESVVLFREPSVFERYRWHLVTAVLMVLLQAAVIGGLLIERHRREFAESETRKRFAEMAHMNRSVAIGALSASIAHEVNQPLAAIQVNANAAERFMVANPPQLNEVQEILGDIKRDNKRASDVIRRVRALLRKAPLELRDVELSQAVGEAIDFLSADASGRGIAFRVEFDSELPRVLADNVQIQQVVIILALNGMDAMRESPAGTRELLVRTCKWGDRQAEVSVADTGSGIAADRMSTIFEPFYTTKPDGMGLGLSIARTIIEAHNGRITAESVVNRGTVVRFTVPFSTAA